jgi:hypothetical protein
MISLCCKNTLKKRITIALHNYIDTYSNITGICACFMLFATASRITPINGLRKKTAPFRHRFMVIFLITELLEPELPKPIY